METLKLVALGIYGVAFLAFTLIVGRALRSRGKLFLTHTFQDRLAVADSVDFLLALGFYIMCAGLLLWNLGVEPSGTFGQGGHVFRTKEVIQTVSIRLGISIFAVAASHTLNILILAILNRNNRRE